MVSVNKKECTGCGTCVVIAPNCFEMGKNNKAQLKKGCKCNDSCKEAAESCPVDAIKL